MLEAYPWPSEETLKGAKDVHPAMTRFSQDQNLVLNVLQGYLAHDKTPTPIGPS